MQLDLDWFTPAYVEHIRIVDEPRVKFKLRARTNGSKEYTCVFCGFHNRFTVSPHKWTNRCGNDECRRWMGFGDIGYILPRQGVKTEPPDLIIPRGLIESYPEGDLGRWKNGQTIHVVRVLGWPAEALTD